MFSNISIRHKVIATKKIIEPVAEEDGEIDHISVSLDVEKRVTQTDTRLILFVVFRKAFAVDVILNVWNLQSAMASSGKPIAPTTLSIAMARDLSRLLCKRRSEGCSESTDGRRK